MILAANAAVGVITETNAEKALEVSLPSLGDSTGTDLYTELFIPHTMFSLLIALVVVGVACLSSRCCNRHA